MHAYEYNTVWCLEIGDKRIHTVPRSVLEQYTIADLLEWRRNKQLELNPFFQRREVWSTQAKSYLVDTILKGIPVPKLYVRSKINVATQAAIRDVVDGQQRIRAIFEFADNELRLGTRSGDLRGRRYRDLDPEMQDTFLSYAIGVENLLNASDSDVLEIFSRLNTYTVSLNSAERRHALYQGDFKWDVHEAAIRWSRLWDEFGIVTLRQRVRMADDTLMSEMFGVLMEGVADGGAGNINRLYRRYEQDFPRRKKVIADLDAVTDFLIDQFGAVLSGPVANAPHFLMLFAATAYARVGIPGIAIRQPRPPDRRLLLKDMRVASENVTYLSRLLESKKPPRRLGSELSNFWLASQESTQRISSRRFRFPVFAKALRKLPIAR